MKEVYKNKTITACTSDQVLKQVVFRMDEGLISENTEPTKPQFEGEAVRAQRKSKTVRDDKMKKIAFTLAEVLITLGIIGVVAAMVMPGIVNYFKVKELETRFKKTDTMIQRALQKSLLEYGYASINDFNIPGRGVTTENFNELKTKTAALNKIWLSQFKYSREVTQAELNSKRVRPKTLAGTNDSDHDGIYFFGGIKQYLLADGTMISSIGAYNGGTNHPAQIHIVFDTNGPFKGPNRGGYDIFKYESQVTSTICLWSSRYSSFGCYHYAHKNQNPTGKSNSYWDILYKPASYW